MSQDPVGGTKRRADSGQDNSANFTINVTVSLGAMSGTMPNVVDVEARSAKLILSQNSELSKLNLTCLLYTSRCV